MNLVCAVLAAARAAHLLQPHQETMELAGAEPAHGPELSNREDARRWLDAERACLIDAARLAAENGWPTHAWQLTRSLRQYLYLYGYSRDQDWVRTHETALAAAAVAGDSVGAALTHEFLAGAYLHHGRTEDPREQLYLALEFQREAGHHSYELGTLEGLVVVCYRLGEFSEALRHGNRAVMLCAGHHPNFEVTLRGLLGYVLAALGRVTMDWLSNSR